MNKESGFFRWLSILADLATLVSILAALFLSLKLKSKNLTGYKINRFFSYFFKVSIILFLLFAVWIYLDFIVRSIWPIGLWWSIDSIRGHVLFYFLVLILVPISLWVICATVWTSSFNTAIDLINFILPVKTRISKQKGVLEIKKAVYAAPNGEIDVTSILRKMVSDNSLTVTANNQLAGDPQYGVTKTLTIIYKYGNKAFEAKLTEGENRTIPEETNPGE